MKNEEMVLRKRAHSFVDRVKEIRVRSNKTVNAAGVMISQIKTVRDEIAVFFADPIDKAKESERAAKAAYRSIVAKKEEVEEPLVHAEQTLKEKIRVYLLEEDRKREAAERAAEEKRQEELRKTEELREKGKDDEADEIEAFIPEEYIKPKPRIMGVQPREKWRFRIIDKKKIPRRYMQINMVKINQEVTEKKGATNIPGIEVYKDLTIAKS